MEASEDKKKKTLNTSLVWEGGGGFGWECLGLGAVEWSVERRWVWVGMCGFRDSAVVSGWEASLGVNVQI